MSDNRPTLFTIGHSNHAVDEFATLLVPHGVAMVADVRSQPYSRRLEQFNRENLAAELKAAGIQYLFLGQELGARRDEPECYEEGQAVYRRIAKLPSFQKGLDQLRERANECPVALMCAEKDPLDCHRTILVGRALRDEFKIIHILADGGTEDDEQAEKRLVRLMEVARTLFEPDLSQEDLIQRAYDKRAEQIAYRLDQEGTAQ